MRLVASLVVSVALIATLVACGGRQSSVPVLRNYTSPGGGTFRVTPQSLCYKSGNQYICGGGSSKTNPSCTLIYNTVATQPLPQSRTTIGVGEQFQIGSNGANMIYATAVGTTVQGSGARTPSTLTAGDLPGTITVAVYGLGTRGCQETDLTLNVIAPSSSYYVGYGDALQHTQGVADIGMKSLIYLYPDTVSFQWVSWQELDAHWSAPYGVWTCINGQSHHPGSYAYMLDTVVPGRGTQVNATDRAYTAQCLKINQFQNSIATVNIPTQYDITGTWRNINTVTQQATDNTSGVLTMTKYPHTEQTSVNAPSSNY